MGGDLTLGGIRGRTFGAILGLVVLVLLTIAASAQAAGEYEPNDSRDTSYGPLAGGTWYTASFETDNDVDWYVFYIKTYSQMDFSAGLVSTCSNCVDEPVLSLYDKDGHFIDDFYSGDLNEVRHLYLTLTPGRYYFEVNFADTGDRYKFRIDPAASITTNRECGEAIVAKDAVTPQLAEANQALAKKAEEVAAKATVVHEAKQELGHASKKAQRLRAKVKRLRRLHRSGWYLNRTRAKLRQVRIEVQNAVEDLTRAEEERKPVWEEKRNLETLAGQRQQEIANAEGQIAAHC